MKRGAVCLEQTRHRRCDDCGLTQPSHGLPGAKRRRQWCSSCASNHHEAVDLSRKTGPRAKPAKKKRLYKDPKMCEGCGTKQPSYGLPAEGWRRWCSGCVAAEGNGAVLLQQQKMCEGCGLKHPCYGLPAERRARWCTGCAAAAEEGLGW